MPSCLQLSTQSEPLLCTLASVKSCGTVVLGYLLGYLQRCQRESASGISRIKTGCILECRKDDAKSEMPAQPRGCTQEGIVDAESGYQVRPNFTELLICVIWSWAAGVFGARGALDIGFALPDQMHVLSAKLSQGAFRSPCPSVGSMRLNLRVPSAPTGHGLSQLPSLLNHWRRLSPVWGPNNRRVTSLCLHLARADSAGYEGAATALTRAARRPRCRIVAAASAQERPPAVRIGSALLAGRTHPEADMRWRPATVIENKCDLASTLCLRY